jgi:hypothetical protein
MANLLKYRSSVAPAICGANGSGHVARDFREVPTEDSLAFQRNEPHWAKENGLIDRTCALFKIVTLAAVDNIRELLADGL